VNKSGWFSAFLVLFISVFFAIKYLVPAAADPHDIAQRLKKYAPTPMPYDLHNYSKQDKTLLRTMIEIGGLADEIFWRQTLDKNVSLRAEMMKRSENDPVRKFFFQQTGPYDRLDKSAPFLDVPAKPPGAGYYPADLTKEDFEKWISEHPEDKDQFLSPYTVIRRQGNRLVAIPYHEEYKEFITPMVKKLREAAQLTTSNELKKYLLSKAEAIQTDRYFQTDVDWLDMKDNAFDLMVGPFEVYEDELNNLKASYQASVEIVDKEETAKLDVYKKHIPDLEANLPIEEQYKNKSAALAANFTIVRDIYRGGDLRVGYQPVATNLPNDPEVRTKKGSKQTFWKNMLEARLNQIILPIGKVLIGEDQVADLTAQGLFDFVLLHEIGHGIGPQYVHGTKTPVNEKLRELSSWIEENKADMVSLHSLKYLRDHQFVDAKLQRQHYVSYFGGALRSIRFGTTEAHGEAAIVSINYFLEHGGITHDKATDRYSVNFEKIDSAIAQLNNELLMIEATGDYARAKKLEEKYAHTPDFLQASLNKLKDLPIDVVPVYQLKWD
jgi:hypothetical protein